MRGTHKTKTGNSAHLSPMLMSPLCVNLGGDAFKCSNVFMVMLLNFKRKLEIQEDRNLKRQQCSELCVCADGVHL